MCGCRRDTHVQLRDDGPGEGPVTGSPPQALAVLKHAAHAPASCQSTGATTKDVYDGSKRRRMSHDGAGEPLGQLDAWGSDNSMDEALGQGMDRRTRHKVLEQRRRNEKKQLMDTLQELVGVEFNRSKVPSALNTILEASLDFLQEVEVIQLRQKVANSGWVRRGAPGPQRWSEVPKFPPGTFGSAFNDAPVPMVMSTPQGRVVRCNPAAFAIFGRDTAEAPTIFGVAAAESLAPTMTAISRLLSGQEDKVSLLKRCAVRSGETVDFQAEMHCLRDKDKRARFLFCTLRRLQAPPPPPPPPAAEAQPQEHQAAGLGPLGGGGPEPQAPAQEPAPQGWLSPGGRLEMEDKCPSLHGSLIDDCKQAPRARQLGARDVSKRWAPTASSPCGGKELCRGSYSTACAVKEAPGQCIELAGFKGGDDLTHDPLMDEIFAQLDEASNQNTGMPALTGALA